MDTETHPSHPAFTFALIHGRGVGPESVQPAADALNQAGHTAIVIENLPVDDPSATVHDYVETAALQLEGRYIDVLVPHSGAASWSELLIARLGVQHVGQVASVSGTYGKPASQTPSNPLRALIPEQRNSEAFRRATAAPPGEPTTFDPEVARQLFYSDVPEAVGRLAVSAMRPRQYRFDEPPLPDRLSVPTTYILGRHDKVRDRLWALAVAKVLNMNFIEIEGGHNLSFSRPGKLAHTLVELARRQPRSYALIPAQRGHPSTDNPPHSHSAATPSQAPSVTGLIRQRRPDEASRPAGRDANMHRPQ